MANPANTLTVVFPPNLTLGELNTFTVQTKPQVELGIHFFTMEASGGGLTKTFEVVVQVEPFDDETPGGGEHAVPPSPR